MRKIFLIRLAVALLLGCGAWGVLAQIEKATLPTPEGMKNVLMQKAEFTGSKPNQYALHGSMMVKEDGFYYFGFHSTSPMFTESMSWMTFDDFEIGQGLSFAAPGQAQELKITPDFDGANEGLVTVKAPILSINNDTITDLTKIDLYRNDKLLHTFSEVAPGGEYIFLEGIQQCAGSYFIFDTSDPHFAEIKDSYAAHSGNKTIASMYNYYGEPNDDWLFSPRLNGKAQTITFYARSTVQNNPENFEYYYSKTDCYPDNFIKLGAKSYISPKWTKYTFDVPEGALYFAIRHVSQDKFILLLDDFTFIPAPYEITDALLSGYIIYRDGMPLNSDPLAATSFTDLEAPAGDHVYRVTAMYDRGESSPSNSVSVKTNAVGGIGNDNATVQVRSGHIIITGASGMTVSVVRHDGIVVYAGEGANYIDMPVEKGVYIVHLGMKPIKVLVP